MKKRSEATAIRRRPATNPPTIVELTPGSYARVADTIPPETGYSRESITVRAMCPNGQPLEFRVREIHGGKAFLDVPNAAQPNGIEPLPLEVPIGLLVASTAAARHAMPIAS